MPALLHRFLSQPRAQLWIIGLGLLLLCPSLVAGFFADDFGQLLLLAQPDLLIQPDLPSLFHLFSFIDDNPLRRQQQYAFSLIPWWTGESFRLNFFRPLSELSHYLDFRLHGGNALLAHLHNLFWYSVLLLLLAAFYRRIFVDRLQALLALLLFVVDATHGFSVAWIANRNALIATVLLLATVLVFIRARERNSAFLLWLSALLVLACLLSTELGMTVLAPLFAWQLLMDPQRSWRRFLALLPALLVFAGWLLFYRQAGFGISGNPAYYIDPLAQTTLFLQQLPGRLLTAFYMQFGPLPLHLSGRFSLLLAITGGLILLGWLLLLIRVPDRLLAFLLLFFLLALLPVCVAMIQERNLLMAGIAGCAMLARLLTLMWQARSQSVMRWLAGLLLFFHLLLSATGMLMMSWAPALLAKNSINTASAMADDWASQPVLSIGVPFFDASFIAAIRLQQNRPLPQRFWNIVTHTRQLTIRRIDNDYLLENPQGLFAGDDLLLRHFASDPMRPGQQFDINGALIVIETVNNSGQASRIRFQPQAGFEHVLLLIWQHGQLQPLPLAAGESRVF